MKKTYKGLTEKYDALSRWEEKHACGTGRHVLALYKAGFNVIGSDIDPNMIKQAQQNAKSRNISATFKVADFKKLNKNFNTLFDAVLCIGNSLSHALTDNDVRRALYEMDAVKRTGDV